MLLYSYAISFTEFPNEISLLLNISECPCKCLGCSEPELQTSEGTFLGSTELDRLIKKHENYHITLVGFMGGDFEHNNVKYLCKFIKNNYPYLKTGMYSGKDYIDRSLLNVLDYYKYGRFIMPKGEPEDWHKQSCGPIIFPWSNQRLLKIEEDKIIDITDQLRKNPLGDLKQYIIKEK